MRHSSTSTAEQAAMQRIVATLCALAALLGRSCAAPPDEQRRLVRLLWPVACLVHGFVLHRAALAGGMVFLPDLAAPAEPDSRDEVCRLAFCFQAMAAALSNLSRQMTEHWQNSEVLTRAVQQRLASVGGAMGRAEQHRWALHPYPDTS